MGLLQQSNKINKIKVQTHQNDNNKKTMKTNNLMVLHD